MENLTQFKLELEKFSLEQLYQEKENCEKSLANMMFDGTLVARLALIETVIQTKESEAK
jgi:hypothetical protein